jgi:Sec-independent protein translocase protein TatA
MNLFGVGPLELAVILIVGLIFVGPDRLPRLAADLARTIREIRKYTNALAAEFNDVVKDVEKETAGEKSVWKEVTESIGGATQQVTEAVRGVRQDFLNTPTPAPPAANGATPTGDAGPALPASPAEPAAWVDIVEPDAGPPGAKPAETPK